MPILATKLYMPPARVGVVSRVRLIQRLNERRKLTLISAPAGFGKTTLITEWATDAGFPIAWVSLDEDDNDLARFLTYFVSALQTIDASIGDGLLDSFESNQAPPIQSTMTTLINQIAASPTKFVLVLDDYHLIENQSIDQAIAFLIDYLPPPMRLIIATRADPDLPLARLRGRGQLTELRVSDLRFTPDEAANFLNQAMGLRLSADHIAALESRTEGWIAGLQLAALSMQDHQDPARFIASFTGSHHFVLDYLVAEVLQRQPEQVQRFLLNTAILERLCGSLCDALLLDSAGQELLEFIQRVNLFVIPLDNERHWYRYHHLFAELLRQRLHQTASENTIATLHNRASLWYEQNGLIAEAFHHAVAAKDFERAARLAETIWQTMENTFQSATWLNWIQLLPEDVIRTHPLLGYGYASALMDAGKVEASTARLQDVERTLEGAGQLDDAWIVKIAKIRAYNAQVLGDIASVMHYTQLALDHLPSDDNVQRGMIVGTLGIAYWSSGDLDAASQAFSNFMTSLRRAGNLYFVIASTFALADIKIAQGHLQEAVRLYKQSLQLAAELESDKQIERITAHLYLGLAMLYCEIGEPATELLQKAKALGELSRLVDWPHRWSLAQARLGEISGDFDGALDWLDEAERVYVRIPTPDTRPIAAVRARIYLRQGKPALDWVKQRGISVQDDLSFLYEFEHITLARILLVEAGSNPSPDALHLLSRLLVAAESGRRIGSIIEILILQALANEDLDALERAVSLAAPEGYIQLFVDEGPPLLALLSRLKGIQGGYLRKLMAAFEKVQLPSVEPLSQRELEVLRLIAQGLSNQEISLRLYLAVSSVKGHNKRIFEKLQVQRRTEAVARARELGLL